MCSGFQPPLPTVGGRSNRGAVDKSACTHLYYSGPGYSGEG